MVENGDSYGHGAAPNCRDLKKAVRLRAVLPRKGMRVPFACSPKINGESLATLRAPSPSLPPVRDPRTNPRCLMNSAQDDRHI